MTETLAPTPEGISRAVTLLRAGGLVAFPTETVYGLGADARTDHAVAGIFEAKDRPRFNPLIVHVADMEDALQIAVLDPLAERVASAFWPGPLTLVLPLRTASALSPLVTADLPSVALRLPAHPLARDLLRAFGGPVAAPSANPSGRVSPTRAEHVLAGLSGRIAAVVDAGPCEVGVESTILGLTDGAARLLRPGGIPAEVLEECLGHKLEVVSNAARPVAPGQLASHYAPDATLRLRAQAPEPDEFWLGFGAGAAAADLNLSETGDLVEAAANLFHYLREADRRAEGRIAVSPIPESGLGRAINDRLRRAAAPRSSDRN
ncbi:Threonylcarbamoyl-AMP synthase [Defluviimonas aquaemixtae]|uniref:Threonylcarbamoyl-AMP synthase n=1 Tax=Albidovulum aquaemixtae TaxID=1542388 RepID=A0A2R8BJD1_9RHOB|nr:L-threonylcarbamoyladenylate synthase [Defluviimonas aquaemixtae]SPH23388.1 Threonylcarbamoyl-AMP synthase [Defluviimonas aquaemixtae]